jgi:hypothetical protein
VASAGTRIVAVREFGALSGGWAWHFMSPAHHEEKHLHDHRDIDMIVLPDRFVELLAVLQQRGYQRQTTRFDDPSGEFVRFEKYIEDACPACHEQVFTQLEADWECLACRYRAEQAGETVKVIFDLFVHEVPSIEANGYTVVEPVHLLGFYGVKHSSEQCVAVQAARRIHAAGGQILFNPELVGDYAL